ncbi:UNVERIFIED_CONTAM: putative inactive receptor kinase [Sesamum indicum]
MASEHQDENGRVIFFEGCNLVFDLEDQLRASAEVLGKGAFGTTYKTALEDSTTVAVKRLKEVIVGKKDFEQQMEGSMSALLHGWIILPKKIAVLVHGNIKASNIFLNSQLHGCVSDLGLATLMSPIAPPVMRTAGYRAPEITDTRKVSQPSDVYSFGVLLLELLNRQVPVHASGGEEVIHLVRLVHSVVREEWTGEVFDVELLRYPNIEEEMVAMLQIGLSCVARMPEQRPKIGEVVKMLEEIRSSNTGNSPSAGTRSPGSTPAVTPCVGEIGPSSVHT